MRILLIEPPFERFIGQRCEWYPIGLTSIATLLDEQGFTARVYNAEHDNSLNYINTEVYLKNYYKYKEALDNENNPVWQEIINVVSKFKPDIVGISVKSVKIPAAIKISRICKNINKNIIIIAGGFHATTKPIDLLKSNCIDIVVRGEGEDTFYELCEAINRGTFDFKSIRGISFKGLKGDIVHTPERPLINSLDTLSFPRRELIIGYKDYTSDQLAWVMTSRGCPYDCAFCNSKAIWNRHVRFISLSKIIDEINYLKNSFKVTHITFIDDSFTVNKKRVLEFCSMLISRRNGITWSCLTRADLIDEEVVGAMKKAGCTKIDIGIESGSERIQGIINKGINLKDVKNAAKILKKYGIFWTGFFMLGFPSETREDMFKTLRFMKEIKPNWVYLSIFTPYPGSKFYDMAKEDGFISNTDNENIFSHQSPNNCFSKNISSEDFKKVTKIMFREFNKHNNSFLSLLRRSVSRKYHKNSKLFLGDIKKALSWLRN